MKKKKRRCRICGQCIEKTGEPCYWVEDDICSACIEQYKFKYFRLFLINDSCDYCQHCVSGKCVKDIPGPGNHCGGNSTCNEWVHREIKPSEIKPKPSLWRRLVVLFLRRRRNENGD
jgi:hypothetical protein